MWMCQPLEGVAGVCEHCLGLGTAIQTLTNQCRQSHKRTDFRTKWSAPTVAGVWSPGQVANCLRRFLPEVESPRRVFSVPEDVVDALESELVVENPDGPVEVFAMTDAAPEEFEGRPVMGRRVVLVPQSADGTPRSHFNVSNFVEADEVSTLPAIGSRPPNLRRGNLQFNL